MDDVEASMIVDGSQDATKEQEIEAWQYLIDTGLVWKLQGYYGRRARQLIEEGVCKVGPTSGLKPILPQEPNTMPHIEHMWAYLSVDQTGNEGIIASYLQEQEAWMPLVAADEDRVRSLRPWAMVSVKAGYTVKLVKFSVREDVETLA